MPCKPAKTKDQGRLLDTPSMHVAALFTAQTRSSTGTGTPRGCLGGEPCTAEIPAERAAVQGAWAVAARDVSLSELVGTHAEMARVGVYSAPIKAARN